MNFVEQILLFFGNYTPIIAFLGAIIGGEETLIFLSILGAQQYLNIELVFIFFYLGILTSDLLWYGIGKSKLFDWLVQRKILSALYFRWGKLLHTATKGNNFQALFLTKFLYGFRLPTIMHMAREKMEMRSFIFYSIITNLIWVAVITTIGWFAGKGIALATNLSDNLILYLAIIGLTLVFFAVFVRMMSNIIKKWLTKYKKQ